MLALDAKSTAGEKRKRDPRMGTTIRCSMSPLSGSPMKIVSLDGSRVEAIHARDPAEPTESWQAPSSSVRAVSAATDAQAA